VDDVRIVGVADVQQAAADAMASQTGGQAFTDYQQMLTSLKPDAVYYCTPSSDHLEQVKFAAENGINVFVEKPVAANVGDALAIADAVESSGILCATGYQWRYNPATQAARDALGDLPVSLFGGWWYWTIPMIPWIADRRFGGGQIFDQCTHLIDLMRDFGGDVASVFASYSKNARSEEELPNWDSYALTLTFKGGAVGTIHSSYATFPGIPESNGFDIVARELLIRMRLGRVTVFRRDEEPVETRMPEGWTIDQPFIEAIRTNDASLIRSPARDSAKSIAVSLAANYSATTGKLIDLDQFMASPPPTSDLFPNAQPSFS
ncbi:MAG: Gfo/Idh/MocA family oxidoreductase, partial [Thermomicrobiales bacterium]